jgi:hypothetical protein
VGTHGEARDRDAVTDEDLHAIETTFVSLGGLIFEHLRYLRRGFWVMQAVILMNIACAAWNATNVNDPRYGWICALGIVANAWGAWRAFRVGEDFRADVKEARARLAHVTEQIKTIERVRNESRA